MDKVELKQRILAALDETRTQVVSAQKATQAGATHEESRSESDKDMRSTELSYIARGQAIRVAALEQERLKVATMELRPYAKTDTVGISALVTLRADGPAKRFFVAPGGAGLKLTTAEGPVHVVTLSSSLGQALIGARLGDFVTLDRDGSDDELEVVALV